MSGVRAARLSPQALAAQVGASERNTNRIRLGKRAIGVTARIGSARPLLGRGVARFNRRFTNRLTRPLARWLPGFGVVIHAGRKSHRRYSTPVNVFSDAEGWVIALTYGTQSDWVKNVLASGGCELITCGRRHELTAPEIRHDERQRLVPRFVRVPLRLLRVTDFMHLSRQADPRRGEATWPSD